MSHHYNPALEAELSHRRASLQDDATQHRLARRSGRAARTAARILRPARSTRA